jgi:Acetyltransferase (GNAT) domain
MKLLRRRTDPERFDRAVEPLLPHAFNPLPLSGAGRRYYEATLGLVEADISYAVLNGDRTVAALVGEVSQGVIGRFSQPAGWMLDRASPTSLQREATREAMGEWALLLKQSGIIKASLVALSPSSEADPLASGLLSLGFRPSPMFFGSIDLAHAEDALERNLRKGHRQQVKWGRANLALTIMNRHNPDKALLENFRQLHCDVSGRATRSDKSWLATEHMIRDGAAFLVLSHLEGQLVGGTLVMHAGGVAYYASGAYRRELFDKPIGHWPVLAAVFAAKSDGLKRFDVGDVTPRAEDSEKDRNIIRFKRGFTDEVTSGLVWTFEQGKGPADA